MDSGQWSGRAVVSFNLFSGAANSRHPDPTKEEWEDVNNTVLPVIIPQRSLLSTRGFRQSVTGESDAAWRKAIEKHSIEGVHVRIGNSGTGAARAYNVRGIPAYFLVDPDGRIVERLSRIRLMTETHSIVEEIIYSLGSG